MSSSRPPRTPPRVVFLLTDGVHLLDLAGPSQVFGTVGEFTGEPWALSYVAQTPVVKSHQGLPLSADTEWPDLASHDLLVVPGWRVGAERATGRFAPQTLRRIASHGAAGGTVASVCAGAFALAEAGILDGRRATTHHALQEQLAEQFSAIRVVKDVLFVDDGSVHTSAGIASGIDLALHLVALRLGPRIAAQVARALVVYARRNGNEAQASAMLRHRDHVEDLVHRAQDLIDEQFTEPLPLSRLSLELGVSARTLTRCFTRAVHITPLQYQQELRRERAEALIAAGSSVENAAREVGFEDARALRALRANRATGGQPAAR